ncbi:MAG TPA: hypothetical protein VNU95_09955 [Candidatus Acidoferrales bacterium]|nr:hypothetical protein [Candidatus Acidoferrales bacterium]
MALLIGITMMTAIQLNGQLRFFAEKIEGIVTNGMLEPEFITIEATISQPAPHQIFCPGFFFTKPAGLSGICHEKDYLKKRVKK